MQMFVRWRDFFPKLGLNQKYIGDGLPLCADLPDRHFLKKGATYVLLGSLDSPKFHKEPDDWPANSHITRFSLNEASSLYRKLCNAGSSRGECQYQSRVVLDLDLPCTDLECSVETLRILEVEPGVFYEYLRVPCAYKAFYSNVKALRNRFAVYTCGDPTAESGAIGCCGEDSTERFYTDFGHYTGELATFEGVQRRCQSQGLNVCQSPRYMCQNDCDDLTLYYWGLESCYLKVKIGLDGMIALVHSTSPEIKMSKSVLDRVSQETKSFFRVVWLMSTSIHDHLADYDGMCDSLGCERDEFDNLCLCSVEVEESMVFNTPPTIDQVLDQLPYGAFSPYDFGDGLQEDDLGNGVKMHSKGGTFSADTIFEVVDDYGLTHFRKNLRSVVKISSQSKGLQLSFRNPVHMMDLINIDDIDAHYETDAALDHYFVSRMPARLKLLSHHISF